MNKKFWKSVGAIVGGFAVVFILSVATDAVLEASGVFPPQTQPELTVWWMLLLALFYRTVYAVLGGYVAAQLAPFRPMKHAIILGCIGVVFAILGMLSNWGKSAEWYPMGLVVLTLPSLWLGGKLFELKKKKK
jgi:hypothetical protein